MRALLYILVALALCLPARATLPPSGSEPTVTVSVEDISDDDAIKTLEHLQRLAHDAVQIKDAALSENAEVEKQIGAATIALADERQAHADAITHADDLQKKVDEITAWGNAQADRADKAEIAVKKWESAYHHLKWGCCLLGALLAGFLAWRFNFIAPLLRFVPILAPYGTAIPFVVGALAFCLLMALP